MLLVGGDTSCNFRETTDIRQWDCEATCGWLESIGLESYCSAARAWLTSATDARGVLANATPHHIEKELAIKHPMHRKKIVLGITDLMVMFPLIFLLNNYFCLSYDCVDLVINVANAGYMSETLNHTFNSV